jgi:uncharacterized protein (UPF0179 family)
LTCNPLAKGARYRVVGVMRAGQRVEVISATVMKARP